MIPNEIEGVLIILAIIGAVICAGLWIWDRIGRHYEPEPPEPETVGYLPDGDQGFTAAPADYSDEVTDEHLKRIAEIVDQGKFENAEVVSGPAWSDTELPAFLKRTRGDQAALHNKYSKRAG